jgi:hypothetical protein
MIDELYSNGILRADNYTNTSPVIPIQQIPEAFDNREWADIGIPADAPFIVWDIVIPGGYDTDFWNCREEIMFWIYDYDVDRVMEIKEFLIDLFGRADLSATDINDFDDPDNVFQFHYFDIMTGLPTDEAKSVLGRYGINMVLVYEYSKQILSNGRLA